LGGKPQRRPSRRLCCSSAEARARTQAQPGLAVCAKRRKEMQVRLCACLGDKSVCVPKLQEVGFSVWCCIWKV
jgi:hypothetical protein